MSNEPFDVKKMAKDTKEDHNMRASEFRKSIDEYADAYVSMEKDILDGDKKVKAILLSVDKKTDMKLFLFNDGKLKEQDTKYKLTAIDDYNAAVKYDSDKCLESLREQLLAANKFEKEGLARERAGRERIVKPVFDSDLNPVIPEKTPTS